MKLYVTPRSPYARLARVVVLEKGLDDRVEIVVARTRTTASPYYAINPSGRVPYLVRDDGVGLEDSRLICAHLDSLAEPRLFRDASHADWEHGRLEALARSLLDGLAVWARELRRPDTERSPTILEHEAARAERLADAFESEVHHPILREPTPTLVALTLIVAIEYGARYLDWNAAARRPLLRAWADAMSARSSIVRTR